MQQMSRRHPAFGPAARQPGPGPSVWSYRIARLQKKPWFRRTVYIALPLLLAGLIGARIATDPRVHEMVAEKKSKAMESLSSRPEFAIKSVTVLGASPDLSVAIREAAGLEPGASSLMLDVASIQQRVAAIGAVRSAHVTLIADGRLQIAVEERLPEALWRDGAGALWLTDREGYRISRAVTRAGYPTLPVILGPGAPAAMAEALAVFHAQPALQPRIRAIVRVGERRWDVLLDRGLRIMLPETEPVAALERVMAWHYGDDLLDRALEAVDMRLPDRPTLRMTPEAAEEFRLRSVTSGKGRRT